MDGRDCPLFVRPTCRNADRPDSGTAGRLKGRKAEMPVGQKAGQLDCRKAGTPEGRKVKGRKAGMGKGGNAGRQKCRTAGQRECRKAVDRSWQLVVSSQKPEDGNAGRIMRFQVPGSKFQVGQKRASKTINFRQTGVSRTAGSLPGAPLSRAACLRVPAGQSKNTRRGSVPPSGGPA